MNILAFDTCLGACSAAAAVGAGTAQERIAFRFERMETGHAEQLTVMIAEVMAETGLEFSQLDRIGVTSGPGTFSGTRIGVAAARGIALATGKPVFALNSLAVMARQAAASAPAHRDIWIAVDVRRDEVYVQRFDPGGLAERNQPQVMSLTEAARCEAGRPAYFAGSGAAKVAALRQADGGEASAGYPELLPDARDLVFLVSHTPTYTKNVAPLYLRAPDAKLPAPVSLQRR